MHRTKIYLKNYPNTHSGGFDLTKLSYTRLEDITGYATGAASGLEPVAPVVEWGCTPILLLLTLALVPELNNHHCELCWLY